MSDQAVLNRIWSATLLEELARFGVQHICVAPGSRSTPLTLEAASHPELTIHTHFDERGLGFFALGIAKATQSPVAVIVTSGTAVANLLPAVVESGLTKEPLILLTADRPQELISCGANQAIHQQGIFSQHVTDALNLPSPSQSVSLNWLLTRIDSLMHNQQQQGGSVHINCPFPEPLYGEYDDTPFRTYLESVTPWRRSRTTYIQLTPFGESRFEEQVNQTQLQRLFEQWHPMKGLVVIGKTSLSQACAAKKLASRLGWPVLCDPQSGVTSEWRGYDVWLQNLQAMEQLQQAEVIVQIGERMISKRLNGFINQQVTQRQSDYVQLGQNTDSNPSHLALSRYAFPLTEAMVAALHFQHSETAPSHWGKPLSHDAMRVASLVDQQLAKRSLVSELGIAKSLDKLSDSTTVFVGNSLVARLVDMFSNIGERLLFSNRGASGIDGILASAAGVLSCQEQPMMTLLGDTSALHDLNSLALFKSISTPHVIVIANNDGGAIFDLLPVPEKQKVDLYQMPHGLEFEHAAKLFGLEYAAPQSQSEYDDIIDHHLASGCGTLIVEAIVPSDQASNDIKQVVHGITLS